MEQTGPTPRTSRHAVGHYLQPFSNRHRQAPPIQAALTGGEGGLWSTLLDLSRWLAFQLVQGVDDDNVLSFSARQALQLPLVIADSNWTTAHGLGWAGVRVGDSLFVGHTGGVGGFESDVLFSPEDRVGVALLLNGVCRRRPRQLSLVLLESARSVLAGTAVDELGESLKRSVDLDLA